MSRDDNFRFFTSFHSAQKGSKLTRGVHTSTVQRPTPKSNVGVVSDGEKCIAPAKSRPKKRQPVKEKDGTEAVTLESILWTEETYGVRELVERYEGRFPVIVRVTEGCCDDSVELGRGQVLQIHSCGRQRRVIGRDKAGRKLSIPFDYPMHVYVRPGPTNPTGEHWQFSAAMEVKKLPVSVKVTRVDDVREGEEPGSDLTGAELTLLSVKETVFLRANNINDGWIDQSEITLVPGSVTARFSVAEGMRLANEHEWTDYCGMFARCVRHLRFFSFTGDDGILQLNTVDSDSVIALDQQQPQQQNQQQQQQQNQQQQQQQSAYSEDGRSTEFSFGDSVETERTISPDIDRSSTPETDRGLNSNTIHTMIYQETDYTGISNNAALNKDKNHASSNHREYDITTEKPEAVSQSGVTNGSVVDSCMILTSRPFPTIRPQVSTYDHNKVSTLDVPRTRPPRSVITIGSSKDSEHKISTLDHASKTKRAPNASPIPPSNPEMTDNAASRQQSAVETAYGRSMSMNSEVDSTGIEEMFFNVINLAMQQQELAESMSGGGSRASVLSLPFSQGFTNTTLVGADDTNANSNGDVVHQQNGRHQSDVINEHSQYELINEHNNQSGVINTRSLNAAEDEGYQTKYSSVSSNENPAFASDLDSRNQSDGEETRLPERNVMDMTMNKIYPEDSVEAKHASLLHPRLQTVSELARLFQTKTSQVDRFAATRPKLLNLRAPLSPTSEETTSPLLKTPTSPPTSGGVVSPALTTPGSGDVEATPLGSPVSSRGGFFGSGTNAGRVGGGAPAGWVGRPSPHTKPGLSPQRFIMTITSHATPNNLSDDVIRADDVSTSANDVMCREGIKRMDDVPAELEGLNVEEVGQCLGLLNMEGHTEEFRRSGVDGSRLSNFSEAELQREFKMNAFNASKLMRFVRGWRP